MERVGGSDRGVDTLAAQEYGADAGILFGLNSRWNAYKKLTENPIDFYSVAYSSLGVEHGSSLLDIGCASGSGIETVYREFDHTGPIVGVDIVSDPFLLQTAVNDTLIKAKNEMELVLASADELPFGDNTFDNTFAMFSLYHVLQPERALAEIQRVTVPGGKIAISTSGEGNKQWHRLFEERIAGYIREQTIFSGYSDIEVPPIFANRFSLTDAAKLLPEYFEVEDVLTQNDALIIRDLDDFFTYGFSLLSARANYKPVPPIELWNKAIEEVVVPVIAALIEEQGRFSDLVHRSVFLLSNKK